MIRKVAYLVARFVSAFIMLQTLYYKFSGSEESVYIFSTIGMEPWGRWGVGILELIASVQILVNGLTWLGAILAMGLMLGAMGIHLTLLGIEVMGDQGQLFYYACIVFICSVYMIFVNKEKVFNEVLPKILKKK